MKHKLGQANVMLGALEKSILASIPQDHLLHS